MLWVTSSAKSSFIRRAMTAPRIVNRYPHIKHLSQKDNFELMMKFPIDVGGEDYDFTPRTFLIPSETALFEQY